jgi:hypothetical protein
LKLFSSSGFLGATVLAVWFGTAAGKKRESQNWLNGILIKGKLWLWSVKKFFRPLAAKSHPDDFWD